MKMKATRIRFYAALPFFLVTFITFSGAIPRPDETGSDHSGSGNDTSGGGEGGAEGAHTEHDALRCIAPGDSFDPVNLSSEEEDLGDGDDNSTDAEQPVVDTKATYRRLVVNRYYGVLRDRFYVRNTEGLISMQLRDGAPTSAATLMGLEDDWKYEYVLAKIDVYYSVSKFYGTMHVVRGDTYAFELQFVHYRKDLGNLNDAANTKHGILVLCVLYESTGKQNPYMDPLVAAAIMSVFPTDKLHVAHGPLDIKALFPTDMNNLQYTGLYPSQPCAREAKFVVFTSIRQVSEKQLKKFREIRDAEGMSNTGVFGEFIPETMKSSAVAVTVSKNVKIQISKKETLSTAERPKASAAAVVLTGLLVNLLFLFRFI